MDKNKEIQDLIDEKLDIVLKALDDKQGHRVEVIDVHEKTSIADRFVIASGNSNPQVSALADEVIDKMALAGYDYAHMEGRSNNRWIVLDYREVMVHIFHREERDYYKLDTLWEEGFEEENKEEEE